MPTRSVSAPSHLLAGWLASMRTGISRLKRLRPSRLSSDSSAILNRSALKDLGLSPGDLPSIKSGQFFQDATRKQR